MNSIQKRFLLFLFGCIGLRSFIVYYARIASHVALTYLAYLAILIATSFTILFIGGYRKTAGEVFGDRVWWNYLRPFHALTHFIFAAMVLSNFHKNQAWTILFVDVIVGLFAFLWFHYSQNNFPKLFHTQVPDTQSKHKYSNT